MTSHLAWLLFYNVTFSIQSVILYPVYFVDTHSQKSLKNELHKPETLLIHFQSYKQAPEFTQTKSKQACLVRHVQGFYSGPNKYKNTFNMYNKQNTNEVECRFLDFHKSKCVQLYLCPLVYLTCVLP